jgi:hypothetical protein
MICKYFYQRLRKNTAKKKSVFLLIITTPYPLLLSIKQLIADGDFHMINDVWKELNLSKYSFLVIFDY